MLDPLSSEELVGEVANNNFKDARLVSRLEELTRSFLANPTSSWPSVLSDAELEGAYRFVSNARVSPEAILGPHFGMARARVALEECVRILHDTTNVSYRRGGKRVGLGGERQSFSAHFSLAVSCDDSRKPLGVVGLDTWVPNERDNEQSCWLKQMIASEQMLGCRAKAIHIADREADDYAAMAELNQRGSRFVIRNSYDRCIAGVKEKLRTVVAKAEHVSERDARINKRAKESSEHRDKIHPEREARTVTLLMAAMTVELKRPANYKTKDNGRLKDVVKTLSVNVVRVWEPEPPNGAAPVEWFLFTNEPIDTPEAVCAVVDHYRARWVIEEFFKALKTGCAFEERQLHSYDAILNALAIYVPIAYHALLLRTIAHHQPDAPASSVVSADQLEVLRAMGRRPLPENPTARDALLCIAALGGHIKYAPDPGWLTIARGYEKLEAYTASWLVAKERFSPRPAAT